MKVLQRKPIVDKDGNTYELEYICMSSTGEYLYNFIKHSGDLIDTIECVLLTLDDILRIMHDPFEWFEIISNIRDNKQYFRIAIMFNAELTNGFAYAYNTIGIKSGINLSTNEYCYDVCKNTKITSLGADEVRFNTTGDIYKLYMWIPQEILVDQTRLDQFIDKRAKKYIEEYLRKKEPLK